MKKENFIKLIAAIGISELAGIIGSFFTITSIDSWYTGLEKPPLNPPNWVFGPVWTTLYALMGISLYLVWSSRSQVLENLRTRRIWKLGIMLFFVQLLLNTTWSIIFFGMQNPGLALVNILLLWIAITLTISVFYRISRPAAYLLIPYIAWVSFAVYLNFSIWKLN